MPIETPHPLIELYRPQWQAIDDVLAGPRAVKSPTRSHTYLPRLPGQNVYQIEYTAVQDERGTYSSVVVDEYQGYKKRAVLLPFAKPLLNRLVGMVFRKAPTFTVPEALQKDLQDITLEGVSAEAFAKKVARQAIPKGFGGILVDYSTEHERPYLRLYTSNAIVSFEQQTISGKRHTTRLVLSEPVFERNPKDEYAYREVPQYREITLTGPVPSGAERDEYPLGACVHQLWRRPLVNGEPTGNFERFGDATVPDRRGAPLGFIPFVPFTPFAPTLDLEPPPFGDLADLILHHYLNSADYEQAMHVEAAGTVLTFSGYNEQEQKQIQRVGGGSMVFSENPQAKGQYVQAQKAGDALDTAMQRKEGQMAIAMGRLILQQQKKVSESAAAQEMQFAGDDANLQQITGTMAMALENALVIYAWWAGTAATLAEAHMVTERNATATAEEIAEGKAPATVVRKLVDVQLNDQFLSGRISADDVARLGLEVEAGRMTLEQYFYEVFVKGERGIPEQTFDAYKAQLEREQKERDARRPTALDPFSVLPAARGQRRNKQPNIKPARSANGNGKARSFDEYLAAESGQSGTA